MLRKVAFFEGVRDVKAPAGGAVRAGVGQCEWEGSGVPGGAGNEWELGNGVFHWVFLPFVGFLRNLG